MNLNAIRPVGPHVTGVIRFASENAGTEDFRLLDHFEVLGRSYQASTDGQRPALKHHPISTLLAGAGATDKKLRSIPVKVIFNDPANILTARYEAFDGDLNRLACVGDGEHCSRGNFSDGAIEQERCAGPDACEYANGRGIQCQLRTRMAVQIDGQADPLALFEFQSGGIHSYRTLAAKLAMLHALLGELREVPLALTQYERGSAAYGYKDFYVADLTLREGDTLEGAMAKGKAARDARADLGFANMETAVAKLRADAPYALGDDAGDGIIFVHSPTSGAQRTRAHAPTAEAGGLMAAQSISDIVARAKRAGAEAGNEVAAAQSAPSEVAPNVEPPALQGIELPGVSAAPRIEPKPLAATAPDQADKSHTCQLEAPSADATIKRGEELAPTPL
jgi:recombination directionality factor gp3-like protein